MKKMQFFKQLNRSLLLGAVLIATGLEAISILDPGTEFASICTFLCLPGLALGLFASIFTTTREAKFDTVMIVVSVLINASFYYLLFKLFKGVFVEAFLSGRNMQSKKSENTNGNLS